MQLTKHHGLANDFLVVLDEVNGPTRVDGALARRVCDRRTGLGADGLIHGAAPGPGEDVDVVMHLYNADGGRAEMSGNGIRCLAQAVAQARAERELHLRIGTDAGPRRVSVVAEDADGRLAQAEAHMGRVGDGPEVPPGVVDRLAHAGLDGRWATADVGNPHLVVEAGDVDLGSLDLAELGSWIEAAVPGGINIEVAGRRPAPDGVDLAVEMRVWERGAGLTEACGTGACATAARLWSWAQADAGRAPEALDAPDGADPVIEVSMPGGRATVRLRPDGEAVLSGPVHQVATVEVPDA